jgi:DNA-binding NtrC family response regulator
MSAPGNRLDLAAWLADLRRLGGQARTLSERHDATTQSFMNLADLQMLEEATKRLIVSLNKGMLYGLPLSHGPTGGRIGDLERGADGLSQVGLGQGGLGQAGEAAAGGTARPSSRAARLSAPDIPGMPDLGRGLKGDPRDLELGAGAAHGIIGETESMRRVHQLIKKAAACSLPVLIQGESGTGKELVARAIHDRSDRGARRFFSENCSALSESLLESELFGHVRGAFTGADRDRKGILELAHGGVLFLDEIGDMSLRMQSKLLRALQEREIRPVGGKESIRIDVRVISATHRSLPALIREAAFREDLFYRINVITIPLPPLRERVADIPALVEHFLRQIAEETGLPRKECSPGTLDLLAAYDWPGNIRELENVIQRAVALGDGRGIEAADLPDRIRHVMITEEAPHYTAAGKAGEQLLIEKALFNYEGDKTRAARFIGWSRPKLYRRMRAYGVPIDFGRPAAVLASRDGDREA